MEYITSYRKPKLSRYTEQPTHHVCDKCHEKKLFTEEFYPKKRRGRFGLAYACKKCWQGVKSAQIRKDRTKVNMSKRKWGSSNKANGKCSKCCSELMSNSASYCEEHYFKTMSRVQLGSYKYWSNLKQLIDSQGYKCYYTGIDLTLGINSSLDHIKPKSKYPELAHDLDNIRFVDLTVNRMKRDLEPERFIEFCKMIANRF